MCVQYDADAGEDVHASRVLALLNAGEVGGINTGEKCKITCFHLLGFTEFLDALADADALGLSIAEVHTHRWHGIEKEITANAIHHLFFVVREVPVEDEFNQMEDIYFVLIAVVLCNVGHDFEELAIRRLYLDIITVENFGPRPSLGRHKLFEVLVHIFPSVFIVVLPTENFTLDKYKNCFSNWQICQLESFCIDEYYMIYCSR